LEKEILENFICLREMKILPRIVLNAVKILNGIRTIFAGLADHLIEEN
jgi:hypothetical protein